VEDTHLSVVVITDSVIELLQFRAGKMCGVVRNDLLGMPLNCCLDDVRVLRIRQIRADLNRLIRRSGC
jgi:hypothetical protein